MYAGVSVGHNTAQIRELRWTLARWAVLERHGEHQHEKKIARFCDDLDGDVGMRRSDQSSECKR